MIGTPQLLISDDDRDFRHTLGELFESRGYHTVLAANGQEAVQIVQHKLIHVVLMDLHMPRLGGAEAIARIKQVRGDLPCILISAAEEALRYEADAYSVLRKPVSYRELTSVVSGALASCYDWRKEEGFPGLG